MVQQKVAIVTGGGSGIGLAIARKFAQEGMITYITGRNEEKLREAKEQLGDNCRAVRLDMDELDKCPCIVHDIVAREGHIDVLVNNAGINMKKHVLDMTDADFQQVILTNLVGVFTLSREVARVMEQQGSGSIIHISSMAAHYGIPKVVAYSAAKTGIEGMTRAMAVDLSPLGIRVNCIAPGYITTDMTSKAFNGDPERKQRVLTRTPLGRMGEPDDVANAAFFLASDASGFITGEVIKVDGGNSIGF